MHRRPSLLSVRSRRAAARSSKGRSSPVRIGSHELLGGMFGRRRTRQRSNPGALQRGLVQAVHGVAGGVAARRRPHDGGRGPDAEAARGSDPASASVVQVGPGGQGQGGLDEVACGARLRAVRQGGHDARVGGDHGLGHGLVGARAVRHAVARTGPARRLSRDQLGRFRFPAEELDHHALLV